LTRQTKKVDLTNAEKFVNVHIFTAGKDNECPIKGDELLKLFDDPKPI